jgi:hypothetical protein
MLYHVIVLCVQATTTSVMMWKLLSIYMSDLSLKGRYHDAASSF